MLHIDFLPEVSHSLPDNINLSSCRPSSQYIIPFGTLFRTRKTRRKNSYEKLQFAVSSKPQTSHP